MTDDVKNETPSEEWTRKTFEYAKAINSYVKEGQEKDWEGMGPQPEAKGREHLVSGLLDALKDNNKTEAPESLSHIWAPASSPLAADIIPSHGQPIPSIALLGDGSILARIGSTYQDEGYVAHIKDNDISELPDVGYFGQGPNKRYFAIVKEKGVSVTDGWQGNETAFCPWPTGQEDLPPGYDVPARTTPPPIERLIPFPDGTRVLLIGQDGIYVLSAQKARRLLPTHDELKEHFNYQKERHADDPDKINWNMYLDMVHGAISHNGEMIAAGSQDGDHRIFNSDGKVIAEIGPQSSYPHAAVFSQDDKMVALNACHFYNGETLGVPTNLFGDYKTKAYTLDPAHTVLNSEDRVYAATSSKDLFITGDAYGYVRGFDKSRTDAFRVFLGSSISAVDISEDGTRLIVSTYAGFLALYDLTSSEKAPHQIGTGSVRELKRWVFWKDFPPLLW